MPDDKTKRGPEDRAKINIHEKYELEYWTKKFGATADQLRAGRRQSRHIRNSR